MHQPAFTFKLNERGEVIMIRDGGSINLGPRDGACEEMCRFLAEVEFGDCAPTDRADKAGSHDDHAEEPITEIDEANFRLDPALSSGL